MVVLPMPGTSSNRTCPSQRRATMSRSMTFSLPTITRPVFWRMERAASCTWRISSVCVIYRCCPWLPGSCGVVCSIDRYLLRFLVFWRVLQISVLEIIRTNDEKFHYSFLWPRDLRPLASIMVSNGPATAKPWPAHSTQELVRHNGQVNETIDE